ncbi:MAG: ATP phosphoribosyltransferase, partial [Muribaculaceae bacterium]|nr:ATP phosphoribosyltransferase [Muribaculaceae bacterium]
LISRAKGFPIDVLYLRDDDIPQAVAMGVADIGIVGQNEVGEKEENVEEVMALGFGKCRLSIAVPKHSDYNGPAWLNGRSIATSYPVLLKKWLDENNVEAKIHVITGSVEIAPAVGMADAIFDIVSTGNSLVQNGLSEVEQVMHSEAVMICNPELSEEKRADLDKLMFRFSSIVNSRGMKYVLMNVPEKSLDKAVALLPGLKSPTILPLFDKGWFSVHAVIRQNELWEKIEQLKEIGAEDILILSLENIIN